MPLIGFTPTYLSWEDFKAVTNVTALKSIANDVYDLLSQRAEFLIDCYVGRQEKYDFDQDTVFPRSEDIDTSGSPIIPNPVAMATARTVEALYKDGETQGSNQNDITSEKIGDYSYNKGKSASDSKGVNLIPPEATLYLSKFSRKSVQISPPEGRFTNGRLNSRQHFLNNN